MDELKEKRAKKVNKKKKKIRMKRRFVAFLFILICTGIIFTVFKAPFFNVDEIICVGQSELTKEWIIEKAGAKTGVNVFSTGVKAMKNRLSSEPVVAECNVRRLFPNKIKIWVREAQAVAYAEQGGQLLLTDKNGQIIKILAANDKDKHPQIAKLEKFKPSKVGLGDYIKDEKDAVSSKTYECIEILCNLGMIEKIRMIDASDLSDIKIDYEDRLYILLGGYEQIEYKLTFINKVITENLSEFEKAILDYRGENLYVEPKVEEPLPEPEEENKEEEKTNEDEEKPQNTEKNANE